MECACARSERHLVVLPAGSSCSRRRSRGSRDFFCALPCVSPSLPSPFCLSLSRHHRPSSLPLPLAITRPNPLPFLDRATPHPYAYAYAYAYARLHSHPHLLSHAHPRYNACTMHVHVQRITLSGRLLPLERSGTFGSKSRWSMNMP